MNVAPFWPLAAALCIGLIAVFGPMALYRDESRIANRTILQFVLTIGLPVLALLGVPLLGVAWVVDLDARVWQALVAGVVIATGWLTTHIFTEITRQKDLAERLRDSHRALYAEIGANLANLGGIDALDGHRGRMVDKMQADPEFVPFVPHENPSDVYTALLPGLHILPRTSIDPVVAYYGLVGAIAVLTQDMRGERFLQLPQDRRIEVYKDYIEMKKQSFLYGDLALRVIAAYAYAYAYAYAEGGRDAARRVEGAVNIPGADRSGQ